MADKRMFSKTIIDSDAFLDMPLSSQALYFHLSMRADDEGFVNNPKKIQRMIGASDDDIKILFTKNFVIPFDSGICVIKHWRIHNYIRTDRFKQTAYKDEKSRLLVKDNGAYSIQNTPILPADCQPTVNQSDNQVAGESATQVRLDKNRLDKISIDKNNKQPSVDDLILSYTDNEILLDTIYEFIDMRKAIKATMTDNAVRLLLKKLDSLSPGDEIIKIAILEQSILNSWKGIFPINKKADTINPKSFNNFTPAKSDEEILDLEKKLLGWDK